MTSKSGSSGAGETPPGGCPPRARELLPKHITSLQAATIIQETKMATAAGANPQAPAFRSTFSWTTLPSADGSILVSDLNREQLWYVAALPKPGGHDEVLRPVRNLATLP
jgi:hypothetical protein